MSLKYEIFRNQQASCSLSGRPAFRCYLMLQARSYLTGKTSSATLEVAPPTSTRAFTDYRSASALPIRPRAFCSRSNALVCQAFGAAGANGPEGSGGAGSGGDDGYSGPGWHDDEEKRWDRWANSFLFAAIGTFLVFAIQLASRSARRAAVSKYKLHSSDAEKEPASEERAISMAESTKAQAQAGAVDQTRCASSCLGSTFSPLPVSDMFGPSL